MHLARAVLAAAVLAASPAALAAPCAGFTDVDDSSPFCVNVEWMKSRNITLGCTSTTLYCPNDPVTRLSMAVFMYRLGFQNAFLQGGNSFGMPAAIGTSDEHPMEVRVGGKRVVRYEPHSETPNVVGGAAANTVTPGMGGATIAGGGTPTTPNRVTGPYGAIGGGISNTTADSLSTVGGGALNVASGTGSTVAGGHSNVATGPYNAVAGGVQNFAGSNASTIAGGHMNMASGNTSTVAGGFGNNASGSFSFAAGVRAFADATGCFVFANWSSGESGPCIGVPHVARFMLDHGLFVDYFARRAADGGGQRWVYFGDLLGPNTISTWNGARLTDTGTWANASDAAIKDQFEDVDKAAVLDRVIAMPIRSWRYKADADGPRHIGPTAQDFASALGLDENAKTIATVDADGVALAAIQGLNAKLEAERAAKDGEIAALRAELAELRSVQAELAAIRTMLAERATMAAK